MLFSLRRCLAASCFSCYSSCSLCRLCCRSGKIITTHEQSSCPTVFAIGDVVENAPELTPVAIQAGRLLAQRLFGKSTEPMQYDKVATTVFTPLEYGCIGYSEEDAIRKFGSTDIEVYHSKWIPLEWSVVHDRDAFRAYAKVSGGGGLAFAAAVVY